MGMRQLNNPGIFLLLAAVMIASAHADNAACDNPKARKAHIAVMRIREKVGRDISPLQRDLEIGAMQFLAASKKEGPKTQPTLLNHLELRTYNAAAIKQKLLSKNHTELAQLRKDLDKLRAAQNESARSRVPEPAIQNYVPALDKMILARTAIDAALTKAGNDIQAANEGVPTECPPLSIR